MNDSHNLQYTTHSYGEHELQRLGVWQWVQPSGTDHPVAGDPSSTKTKYWFIYVHGGIWRDPRITHLQATPTVDFLSDGDSPRNRACIAGFASIEYRLSPHRDFPQDAATTPATQLRAARHPDHLRDVRDALAYLRREIRVGDGAGETPYVLWGHSCGATLALQVVMGLEAGPRGGGGEEVVVPMPAAVVGFQGMYDLVGLNERFGGAYAEMIAGAFGEDEEVWKQVSPARFTGRFGDTWDAFSKGRAIVSLAYSREDEWVDVGEIDAMESRLRREAGGGPHVMARRDLTGGHDAVAEDGRTVATVLMETVAGLDKLERDVEDGGWDPKEYTE